MTALRAEPGHRPAGSSSDVRFLGPPGQRALAPDRQASGRRHRRVGEQARGDDQRVSAAEGIARGIGLPEKVVDDERPPSPRALLLGARRGADVPRARVHREDRVHPWTSPSFMRIGRPFFASSVSRDWQTGWSTSMPFVALARSRSASISPGQVDPGRVARLGGAADGPAVLADERAESVERHEPGDVDGQERDTDPRRALGLMEGFHVAAVLRAGEQPAHQVDEQGHAVALGPADGKQRPLHGRLRVVGGAAGRVEGPAEGDALLQPLGAPDLPARDDRGGHVEHDGRPRPRRGRPPRTGWCRRTLRLLPTGPWRPRRCTRRSRPGPPRRPSGCSRRAGRCGWCCGRA